jgi:protein TonB
MAAKVTDADRLSFMVFLALALHAMIVLGITFAPEDPDPAASTMEITLSQRQEDPPEEADFLAQSSQKGSGTEAEVSELTTTRETPASDTQVREVDPLPVEPAAAPRESAQTETLTTQSRSRAVAPKPEEELTEDAPERNSPRKSLMDRSLEIASLEARLDQQMRTYAKRPRIERVTSVSTLEAADAWYVQNWVDRVTRLGNMNYPKEARRRNLHGSLRLLVALYADGSVREISVLESSGHKVLDDAAQQTIRAAAPFAPFPESMRKTTDQLEIIRTWSFQPRGLSTR